ncbi:hypothetical protein C0Q70_09288 [Pomacea canaliculata]|uniref:Uncharacterized protein n=1 Tax=Pomacea canaliculata TaxID=400727 RepID=A0A2T7P9C6_POMCA|nr:hypothetical protein C0Q70_09288 [Pomacea canaliculata]
MGLARREHNRTRLTFYPSPSAPRASLWARHVLPMSDGVQAAAQPLRRFLHANHDAWEAAVKSRLGGSGICLVLMSTRSRLMVSVQSVVCELFRIVSQP